VNESLLVTVLPEVFQASAGSSTPLRALAAAADDLQRPVFEVLDTIHHVVDPYRAPGNLVPYLSQWVDLDWLIIQSPDASGARHLGVASARQRDLIANAADLSARRGTPAGMVRFLHLATGADGFEVEDVRGQFHVVVRVPAEAADQIDLVRRIVAAIKPAHITEEVVLAVPVGPSPATDAEGPVEPNTSPDADTSPDAGHP
jgi:phage tail-like protein